MNAEDTNKILVCIGVHEMSPYSCWRCMQKDTIGLCNCSNNMIIYILAINAEILASLGVHLR
jgi:hypothetical protein